MHRKLCILQANCQGDEYNRLLETHAGFMSRYRLVRYTNYTREHIPDEELARCELFLYQHLGENWGDLASDVLLAKLPPSTPSICLPNMFFKGYWPFWTGNGPIDYSDTLLNRLIDEGATKPMILKVYMQGGMFTPELLKKTFDDTIAHEREKEKRCFMTTWDLVLRHWRKEFLFHTVNHPGPRLLLHVANGLLDALNLPPLDPDATNRLVPQDEPFPMYSFFHLPFHPKIAEFHKLSFGGAGYGFKVFERTMTFEQYISRYIDCRQNGYEELFTGYLQVV